MTFIEQVRAGIGALVWMTLRNVELPRADLRAAFQQHGLERAVPRDPSPSATLARAIREALVGEGSAWAFDRVRDDSVACTAALSQRVVHPGTETVTYEQRGLVRVVKATGVVDTVLDPSVVAGSEQEQDVNLLLGRAKARYVRTRDYATTEDLRASLVNALQGRRRDPMLGAVNVDGVSFVLNEKRPTIEALAQWVADREYGKVTVVGIADDTGTRAEVAGGARDTIARRVTDIVADAAALTEKVRQADEDELDGLLEPYLERFALAEAQAAVYAGVLGSMSADLDRTIREAREAFAARVL